MRILLKNRCDFCSLAVDKTQPARRPRGSSRGSRDVPHGDEHPQSAGVAERLGITRLLKDQALAICGPPAADAAELLGRDLSGLYVFQVWLDATYVRCHRDGKMASIAVVTAIGCDSEGSRHVLGLGVVDAESYDLWLSFLYKVRGRACPACVSCPATRTKGLRRAISEEFQGAV